MHARITPRRQVLALASAGGLLCLLCSSQVLAEEAQTTATEQAAARLLASTVTVRISTVESEPVPAVTENEQSAVVTVCSGVSLGQRLVVTFSRNPTSRNPTKSRFRVTLPGGEQSAAELRVLDTYSGLVLLEIDSDGLRGLDLTDSFPPVGGAVLTAAAAGIEPPVVSLGILGAANRNVSGTGLPPVLQCDVRTTESSSGAAVVDQQGRLIGVVAATPGEPGGWTYAVPARHVQRLLRVRPREGYRVLRRQRPTVGLTMRAGTAQGTVEVERVEPGGPAERAGIRPGDLVLAADGRKIRSPYQAVALIIRRQPGDTVDLTIEQPSGKSKTIALTLGGAIDYPALAPHAADHGIRVGPQLEARATAQNRIQLRRGGRVEEVAVSPGDNTDRLPLDEVSMLRRQLTAFEKVILQLQAELIRRNKEHAETRKLIDTLTRDISQLRQQLDAVDQP